MSEKILEFKDITKSFPGVKALKQVTFSVNSGEVHALVGENGAGKSTLLKILSGVYPYGSYDGNIYLSGEKTKFSNIKESEAAGIAIIYQELALIKQMSIAENIYLGDERLNHFGTIDWDNTASQAREYLREVGLDINPFTKIINLGVGKQQLVEIAKALSKNAKLLLLDEPTAALTESETKNLFNILERLKKRGVTCIFITHKLSEVFACADSVTVIRDGSWISTDSIENTNADDIITKMVGRKITNRYPKEVMNKGELVMEVKNWTLLDPELPERKLVDNVSFSIRKGEVLGLAGLMGAGRTELATSLFGCYPKYTSGELFLDGEKVIINSPIQAIKNGVSYVPEDRKRFGLNLMMNITDNVTMASLDKLTRFGTIDNIKKIITAEQIIKDMNIKAPSADQVVAFLSGGNQQKTVIGKWLLTEPKVLMLDEPTRGIDVGSKIEIYKIINKLVAEGVCIIMISSELPEVLGMSDRVLVICKGQVAAELQCHQTNQEEVMYYATGRYRYDK